MVSGGGGSPRRARRSPAITRVPRQSSSGLTSPSTRRRDHHAGDAPPLEGDFPGSQVPDRALIDPDLAGEEVPDERLAHPGLTGERDTDAAHLGGDPIRPGEPDAAHGHRDVLGGRLRDAAHPTSTWAASTRVIPPCVTVTCWAWAVSTPPLVMLMTSGRVSLIAVTAVGAVGRAAGADVVAAREAVAVGWDAGLGVGWRWASRLRPARSLSASRLRRRRSRPVWRRWVAWRRSFAPASPSASLPGRRRPWLDRRSRVDRSWT